MNHPHCPSHHAGSLPAQATTPAIPLRRTFGRFTVPAFAAALLFMGSSGAKAVLITFDDLALNTSLSTVPGWTTSSPDNFPNAPLAWVGTTGASNTGAVGGVYDAPAATTYAATVATPLPLLIDGAYNPIVSFDLAIIDSTNTYPGRDRFGFAVNDSTGSPTVSVEFRPVAQTATPATLVGLWEVLYTVRGGVAVNTTLSLQEGTAYSMQVAYQPTGIQFSFGTSALENQFVAIPTGYVPSAQSITGVSYTWTKTAANASYGDNYILFDNLSVAVPEPTAAMMAAAGLPLLLTRRRRTQSITA